MSKSLESKKSTKKCAITYDKSVSFRRYHKAENYKHMIDVLIRRAHDPIDAIVTIAQDDSIEIKYKLAANMSLLDRLVAKQTAVEITPDDKTSDSIDKIRAAMQILADNHKKEY